MSAANYKDATSKTDLEDILKQCSICYRSTNDGNFILCHSDLPNILLKNYKKLPTYNLIINSLDESDGITDMPIVGHWFNIIVLKQAGRFYHALICDSLSSITSNHAVMQNIKKFCSNNSLRLHYLSGKYQGKSNLCGYLASGIIAYIHGKNRLNDMTRLQKLFLRNSVKTNENLVLKMYKKHFTWSFLHVQPLPIYNSFVPHHNGFYPTAVACLRYCNSRSHCCNTSFDQGVNLVSGKYATWLHTPLLSIHQSFSRSIIFYFL